MDKSSRVPYENFLRGWTRSGNRWCSNHSVRYSNGVVWTDCEGNSQNRVNYDHRNAHDLRASVPSAKSACIQSRVYFPFERMLYVPKDLKRGA